MATGYLLAPLVPSAGLLRFVMARNPLSRSGAECMIFSNAMNDETQSWMPWNFNSKAPICRRGISTSDTT